MRPPPHRDADPEASAVRFNELWEAYAARVLAYATRHVGPDAAQEVVAETFLVAWRRLAEVPGQPLPWLIVVARNTVANHRRSGYRQAALRDELARLEATAAPAPTADDAVAHRAEVLAALAAMSPKEREALLLVAWDGLGVAEAAIAAGCSTSAMHVRLFRARRRLRSVTEPEPEPAPATLHPALPHPTLPHPTTGSPR